MTRTHVLLALSLTLFACENASPEPPPAASAAPAVKPETVASAVKPHSPEKPAPIPAPEDVAQAPADAQKTASGLVSKVLQAGTGTEHPGPQDSVNVHYTGWTKDGKMFDSSVQRGAPATFRVDQVIKGWTEGLQLMVKGEKRRLWIPGALAYGDTPRMGAPAGDLTFDVELLDITAAPKPPAVPEDVKAPPKTAKKTASGLAYRVLKAGTGAGDAPKAQSTVMVNYSGWTTDGKMFDSSVTRGRPASFRVDQVIKGWTEGLQLMKVGDSYRFWIPAALAYGEKPKAGAPAGMLVFDVELVAVR